MLRILLYLIFALIFISPIEISAARKSRTYLKKSNKKKSSSKKKSSNTSNIKEFNTQIKSRKKMLKDLKKELDGKKKEIKKLRKSAKNIGKLLVSIDEQIVRSDSVVLVMRSLEDTLKQAVDSLQNRLFYLESDNKVKRTFLQNRVRAIYKHGRYNTIDLVLGSASLEHAIKRYNFFYRITKNDRKIIDELERESEVVTWDREEVEERLSEIALVIEEKNSLQEQLGKNKKEKKKLLKKVKGKKRSYEKLVKHLQNERKKIFGIIAILEKERKAAKASQKKRTRGKSVYDKSAFAGSLIWPIKGKVVKNFGKNINKTYRTVTINNGIDIAAKTGTKVKCSLKGKVAHVGSGSGFGLFIIVTHGGGYYTLYGHLSSVLVKKGDNIKAGKIIAASGESGSFEGPKLHFEFYKGSKPMNPRKWLK